MKYVNVFLSLLLFISSTICTYEIRLLDQKKIDQEAIAIEKKVTRDYYMRAALVGMVAVRIAYAGFKYLNSSHDKGHIHGTDATLEKKDVASVQQPQESVAHITWGEWAHNVKTSWVEWAKYLVSKENIKNSMISAGKFGLATSFQMSMGSVMQGVYVRLNYPNTLRWYICSYVPYIKTIKHIKETIVLLQDQSLRSDQRDYNKDLLQEACNRLVRDGEKLCAYMTYKTKQLDIEEQQIAERTVRYFFKYYNEFLSRISDQLACDVIDYNTVDTMLTSFETDIKRQFKLFFFIEGETDEERAMIGERMKRSVVIDSIAGLF